MRRSFAVAVVAVLGLAAPAAATAATRYVEKSGTDVVNDCTNQQVPCAHVQYAVGQAAPGDTIQVGPGTFEESVTANLPLTLVGAGGGSLLANPGGTTIRAPNAGLNADGANGLTLPAGGTVRAMRVQGGDGGPSGAPSGGSGGTGIEYESSGADPTALSLDGVVVVGGDGGQGSLPPDLGGLGTAGRGIFVNSGPGPVALSAVHSEFAGGEGLGFGNGAWVDGPSASADLIDSRIPNADSYGDALAVFDGARVTLEGVDAEARQDVVTIYDGSLAIRRSRLEGEDGPGLYVIGSNDESPEVELTDSLLTSGLSAALYVESEEEGSASVRVLGSTLIGHGSEAVYVEHEEGAGPANLVLRNSIARHLPLFSVTPPTDLHANGGTIDADFSSFTTRLEENGGTVTAPGSAHNLAGDPGFIDAGNGVFILQSSSPLVDRGDPGIVQAGERDLGGAPRALDGNRDCQAVPDIGAFEVTGQSVACIVDPRPVVSAFGMTNRVFAPVGGPRGGKGRAASVSARRVKRGTRFTFTLSEPARVTIAIERKARGRKAGPGRRARCVKPTPANRKARRCVRFLKVGALSAQAQAGRQSLRFSGRLRGKPLKPGGYRATIVAVDSAGQASDPRRVSFRVVRG
jgi:hypothetical protein